ncbi:MAG: hypothetical protein JWN52_481 [Actinomycetia bacterium]|nr:hypothetical protein [Actinomycetes bacterium]
MVDGWMKAVRAGGMVAASAAAMSLMLPLAAAHADGSKRVKIDKKALATHGVGKVWFYDGVFPFTRAGWDLTITDIRKDKWCAEAKIVLDLGAQPDKQYRSKRACGKGKTGGASQRFNVNKSNSFKYIMGVKVQLCQVEEVSLANELCKTVQYVKNAY